MSAALWVDAVLLLLALLHAAVAAVLVLQVVASTRPGSDHRRAPSAAAPRVAVLVPAHDEELTIAATLEALRAQLEPGDRLLVVADNCIDRTAAIARQHHAEVIERTDPLRRGKGYALDAGIRHLEAGAGPQPQVLLIVDADCELHPGGLRTLGAACLASGRPVQALDLMRAPAGSGRGTRLAEFAWIVRNHARPLGCLRLGWPCQLMGTGMALPWPLMHGMSLASSHLAEDMQLGVDLALRGAAPQFCPDALVTSLFPASVVAQRQQRARWERGHLGTLLARGPRLLLSGAWRRDAALLAMGLDLCVPPLALFVLSLLTVTVASGVWAVLSGAIAPMAISALALVGFGGAVLLAWSAFGRQVVSLREMFSVPFYVVAKLPMYARLLLRPRAPWVRTQRDDKRA